MFFFPHELPIEPVISILVLEMLSLNGKVTFDHVNPNSETSTDARQELAHLDYSPLKRVSGRSLCMGLLVSMGGLIFGYGSLL